MSHYGADPYVLAQQEVKEKVAEVGAGMVPPVTIQEAQVCFLLNEEKVEVERKGGRRSASMKEASPSFSPSSSARPLSPPLLFFSTSFSYHSYCPCDIFLYDFTSFPFPSPSSFVFPPLSEIICASRNTSFPFSSSFPFLALPVFSPSFAY